MKVKDENYLEIQGWMRTRLGLKGSELLTYGLIYGFSQDGDSWFSGSASYIADWVGVSRQQVLNVLKRLVDKGLIIRQEKLVNGVKLVDYKANPKKVTPCQETLQGGCKETLHHTSIQDNSKKDDTKVSSKKEPSNDAILIENEIVNYTVNEKLRAMLREFVEYRIQKRERMSERAFKMMLNKLEGFTDEEQIDALETSIISNWAGVFPKHKDRIQNQQKQVGKVAHKPSEYDEGFDENGNFIY